MNRWMRDFRLVPIVLIAVVGLFVLKSIGIVFDGGYTLGQRLSGQTENLITTMRPPSTELRSPSVPLEVAGRPSPVQRPWLQEMFFDKGDRTAASAASDPRDTIITGSVNPPKPAAKEEPKKDAAAKPEPPKGEPPVFPERKVVPAEPPRQLSRAERAILERLQERRQELESRARELDARESLLKEAEQKLDPRLHETKAPDAKADPAARKEDAAARYKSLVTIYESMKPKDAAKIFERLDIKVLLEMATQINPRRMSEILSQMSPEAAERLTVELAARASGVTAAPNPNDLPKIEGRPTRN
ncbi:MAG: flagellar protein FlbB [Alphaproteobacteria bacterium]|nr:flagellar protein FlbB [Alphaproteobacteria bacterium]